MESLVNLTDLWLFAAAALSLVGRVQEFYYNAVLVIPSFWEGRPKAGSATTLPFCLTQSPHANQPPEQMA